MGPDWKAMPMPARQIQVPENKTKQKTERKKDFSVRNKVRPSSSYNPPTPKTPNPTTIATTIPRKDPAPPNLTPPLPSPAPSPSPPPSPSAALLAASLASANIARPAVTVKVA